MLHKNVNDLDSPGATRSKFESVKKKTNKKTKMNIIPFPFSLVLVKTKN